MGGYDVLATNKILHFVFLAPFLLFLYTFVFYILLRYSTRIPKQMVLNISVVFFIIFPFYTKYSIEVFDDFMEGSRLILVRLKRKFGKELIKVGGSEL